MYNMIAEDEVETYGSIVDFDMMFIRKNGMIVIKQNNFNSSLLAINKLKVKKLIMHFEMH